MNVKTKCTACRGTGRVPLSMIFSDVLRVLRGSLEYDSGYVASELDIEQDTACKRLNELVRFGLIERTGTRCNYRYRRASAAKGRAGK